MVGKDVTSNILRGHKVVAGIAQSEVGCGSLPTYIL